jgi:hypothetical protein
MDALMGRAEDIILDKQQFLSMAVESLLNQIDATTLHTIVATGRDEFMRIARAEWSGHGFTGKDYRRAFQALKQRAAQVPVVGGKLNAN